MRHALALTLFLLTSCVPLRTGPQPDLPPIPSQVISQLGPVPVVAVDSLSNSKGDAMLGGFHMIRRTIYIRRDVLAHPRLAWVVLLHEQCHIWSIDTGIAALLDEKSQQAVCDASATYRVAEMLLTRRKH